MSEWTRTQITRNSVEAKCNVIISNLQCIKRIVNKAGVNDSEWIHEAHGEAMEVLNGVRDILEILDNEQGARLAEYEEHCSLTSAMRKTLYRENEVANE